MGRLREWHKSLLDSISPRGQAPSPQTPSPQKAPQNSSTSKNEAAARNALIAGTIGAGLNFAKTEAYNAELRKYGLEHLTLSAADRAASAIANGARLAAVAGTYTASDGSVLVRAAKGLGAGFVADIAVSAPLGALARVIDPEFGVGRVARPYV